METSPEAGFTAFVEAEREWLGRLAVMLVRDRHAGEDLLQETLVRVYLAWHRIDHDTAFAYARRTMTNLATDRWRRSRHEPVGGHEADRDDIVRQLAWLTERERTMVVLRYYADLSEAEVAQEMGVSRGTVKSTCSRALARLRSPQQAPAGRTA